MARKAIFLLALLVWTILACNAPVGPTMVPMATASPTVIVVTPTPTPTYTADMSATAPMIPFTPTPPAVGRPNFGAEILFSTVSDAMMDFRSFPAGMTRIYAEWTYSGMAQGMLVRREWYLDGVLWLEREEAWNAAKYGATGTLSDISIYDLESGLPSGYYELRLYIDGQPQFSAADAESRSFDIAAPGEAEQGIPSPDGKYTIAIKPVNRIQLRESNGQWRTLVEAHWVHGIDWFPNSSYIVYSDRIQDESGLWFRDTWELWIVHIASGTTYQIGKAEERLFLPKVSPDGFHIAVVQGTAYGDACVVDLHPVIIELDTAKVQRNKLYNLDDFSGLPFGGAESSPYIVDLTTYPLPGVWQNATQLAVPLRWTCTTEPVDGIYSLDVTTKSANRIADLPVEGMR